MKILWVKTDFLHPTERGGQIRTLEMVRRLHKRHEVHYLALDNVRYPEGPRRAGEYSSFAYPVPHEAPPRGTLAFYKQALGSLTSSLPLSVSRYGSAAMRAKYEQLVREHKFDRIVCDFVFPGQNIADLSQVVVFQHNVETIIWRRHAETAQGFLKWYFGKQAERMLRYEERTCKAARHIVTVSESDAEWMRKLFGLKKEVSVVPTGVDCEYFAPPPVSESTFDLVFVGAMDWMPNIDGMLHFTREVWPRLRSRHPEWTLGIVGRAPTPEIRKLGEEPGITVTGTVPDVRPYVWGSRASIVPLRIGGGTRLKIYEAMAAGVPVISTSIGAEGLPVEHGQNIRLADTDAAMVEECEQLLGDEAARRRQAEAARQWVYERFSWDSVVDCFEQILKRV